MNLITVIPLSRAKIAPELSYFTAVDVPVGALVTVPLRRKSIHGIVVSSEKAEDFKQDIKRSGFELRKLNKVKAVAFFPSAYIAAAKRLADYYASTVGAVINSLVAEAILDNAAKVVPPVPAQESLLAHAPAATGAAMAASADQTVAVQGDDADRMSTWRSLIRQEFARKRSLAIYAPTIEDCHAAFAAVEKGIEGYIFELNGSMTKKKVAETWAAIADVEHPVVVVATPSFSILPRHDIETIILERENGRGWVSQRAPYLDMRHALEAVGRARHMSVFLADALLRVETLERLHKNEIEQGSPFKWRASSDARDTLIDMRTGAIVRAPGRDGDSSSESGPGPDEEQPRVSRTPTIAEKQSFRVLSPELETLIARNLEESTHLFILALRRGLSSMTVCDDCGTMVSCRQCSAPMVLHASANGGRTFFMCHVCGERQEVEDACTTCGGWRLSPLGVGIDRVQAEIRERYPDVEIFKLDAETAPGAKEADAIMEGFRATPGSVLLGTEMALLRLSGPIEHVAVASLDSLLSLPDFRIQEKIMYALTRLRARASRTFLVQTRRAGEKVFGYGLKGTLSDFCRAELDDRKRFGYPPFSVLAKITVEGAKDKIAARMAETQKALEPREVDVFPAFTPTVRGRSIIHGLIKIEPHAWPDPELVALLRSLPPDVSIRINPETLL